MLLIAVAVAAAIASPPAPPRPVTASAQARATVRIVSAVRLRFDQPAGEDVPLPRQTRIRGPGAELLPARLIEFE